MNIRIIQLRGDKKMIIRGNDISMIRGDSESVQVSCFDAEGNKIPFMLGDRVYMTVKESFRTPDKILQKLVVQFTEFGDAIIEIEPQDTKDLDFENYVYDIQFVKADGKVKTIVPPSIFSILGEVTYE